MALKLKTFQEHVTAREAAGFRHLKPLQEVCTTPVGFAPDAIARHCQGARGRGTSPSGIAPGQLHDASWSFI